MSLIPQGQQGPPGEQGPPGPPGSLVPLATILNEGNSAGTYTINMNGNKIQNLGAPTAATDAANKSYVDGFVPLAGGTITGDLTVNNSITASEVNVGFNSGQDYSVVITQQGIQMVQPSGPQIAITLDGAQFDVIDCFQAVPPGQNPGNINFYQNNLINFGGNTLNNVGTPSIGTDAATKAYVDSAVPSGGPFLPIAGGTLNGNLTMATDQDINLSGNGEIVLGTNGNIYTPTISAISGGNSVYFNNPIGVANVGNKASDFFCPINMNTQKITSLATPTDATDAATKGYVDSRPAPTVPTLSAVLTAGRTTGGKNIEFGNNTDIIGCANGHITNLFTDSISIEPGVGINVIGVNDTLEIAKDKKIQGVDSLILSAPATKSVRFDVNETPIAEVKETEVVLNKQLKFSEGLGRIVAGGNNGGISIDIPSPAGALLITGEGLETMRVESGTVSITGSLQMLTANINMNNHAITDISQLKGANIGATPIVVGSELNMSNNAITNCPTITALQTDKADKANTIYVNSVYVNDNVNDIQTALDSTSSQGTVFYMSAGSYGGSDVQVSGKNNIAILAPPIGTPATICELADGRGMIIYNTSQRIKIANLSIKGLLTLQQTGNNYYNGIVCSAGMSVSGSGSHYFYNSEFSGPITVSNTFAGVIVFSQCNFSGATFSLTQASPLQVQFALCINLPTSRPTNAFYGTSNSSTAGVITENVNVIAPVLGQTSFSTTGCSTLAADMTLSGQDLTLKSQSGATLKTITLPGNTGVATVSGGTNITVGGTSTNPVVNLDIKQLLNCNSQNVSGVNTLNADNLQANLNTTTQSLTVSGAASAASLTVSGGASAASLSLNAGALTNVGSATINALVATTANLPYINNNDTLGATIVYDTNTSVLSLKSQQGNTLSTATIVSGGGGGGGQGYYNYKSDTTLGPGVPPNGHILWDNATQINATIINVSHLTSDGTDIDVFLELIKPGWKIVIQDKNDSTIYQTFTVNTVLVSVNSYYTFGVSYYAGAAQFANNSDVILIPIAGAPTPTTPTLAQVLVQGTSAGSNPINMNGQNITSANSITATTMTANYGKFDSIQHSTGAGEIQVNNDMNFNNYTLTGLGTLNVANINGTDPGQPGSQWTSTECSNLAAELNWNNTTRELTLKSQTGADVGTATVIGAGNLGQVLNNGAVASTSIQMNNNSIAGTANLYVDNIQGNTPGNGEWTSASCASLAADLSYNSGTGALQLKSQTGVPIGSSVVISGGGGSVGTIAQVLNNGSDANNESLTNLNNLQATTGQFGTAYVGSGGIFGNTNTIPFQFTGINGVADFQDMAVQVSGTGTNGGVVQSVKTLKGRTDAALNIAAQITNPLTLTTNGAEAMRITSAQNVGIGTTSPSEKLEVNGNIKLPSGSKLLGDVQGTLTGTASNANNLTGHTLKKLPFYNATDVLSFADTSVANSICSTDGSDVVFVNQNTLNVNGATNVRQAAGLPYNASANTTSVLSAGSDGQLVSWLSGVPVNTSQSAITAGNATLAARATNVASSFGGVVYNTSANNTTTTSGLGTNGQLVSTTGSALAFTSPSSLSVASADNLTGGVAGNIIYQTGAGTTGRLTNGTAKQVLTSNGPSAPVWTTLISGGSYTLTTSSNAAAIPANSTGVIATWGPVNVNSGTWMAVLNVNVAGSGGASTQRYSITYGATPGTATTPFLTNYAVYGTGNTSFTAVVPISSTLTGQYFALSLSSSTSLTPNPIPIGGATVNSIIYSNIGFP